MNIAKTFTEKVDRGGAVPRHIAIIPDGNRRWAQKKGVRPWEGHDRGIKVFKDLVNWCYDAGVYEVTGYSLSKENLIKRDSLETKALFALYEKHLQDILVSKELEERKVRIRFIGEPDNFPKVVIELMQQIEAKTERYKKRRLNLCINYSGRGEIVQATKAIVRNGERPEKIDEKMFESYLMLQSSPDLLIRTAEKRLSNFLLWQIAYAEIYFSPKLFPDFTKADLLDAINQYAKTERRFGK